MAGSATAAPVKDSGRTSPARHTAASTSQRPACTSGAMANCACVVVSKSLLHLCIDRYIN
jgi:hypothetical protein